jgi:hypothetical protein
VTLSESGRTIWKAGKYQTGADGITAVRKSGEALVVDVGSGIYAFALARE